MRDNKNSNLDHFKKTVAWAINYVARIKPRIINLTFSISSIFNQPSFYISLSSIPSASKNSPLHCILHPQHVKARPGHPGCVHLTPRPRICNFRLSAGHFLMVPRMYVRASK